MLHDSCLNPSRIDAVPACANASHFKRSTTIMGDGAKTTGERDAPG
jgi:hypothetical protein